MSSGSGRVEVLVLRPRRSDSGACRWSSGSARPRSSRRGCGTPTALSTGGVCTKPSSSMRAVSAGQSRSSMRSAMVCVVAVLMTGQRAARSRREVARVDDSTSLSSSGDAADHLLRRHQRPADPPRRPGRHARHDDPRRLRRRRAHRAPRRERDGPLPRAPGVQGRPDLRRLPQGQRDGRAHGRLAERLHVARPRRLPHHRARRGGDGGHRPADRLRRAPEDRSRRARQGARRRHPGDPALQGPARRGGRGAHRPRALRRPSAGPHRARPRGPPADLLARGDRRLPRAPLVGRARRRVHRRQRRPRAGQREGRRALRALPRPARARGLRARAGVRAAACSSSSATPTSRTCA